MDNKVPDNIILIGMPAAGKSTVGVLLAKRLGFDFIDTDLLIQKRHGLLLHQIIENRGMQAFLDLESQIILELEGRHRIIATGGSVIYRPLSMQHLQSLGTIVLLEVDLDSLQNRLTDLNSRGVVRAPGQTIRDLFEERNTLYQKYSQLSIATGNLSPGQVVESIVDGISGRL